MSAELFNLRVATPEGFREVVTSSPEEQQVLWENRNYLLYFPTLVTRVLSEEGLQEFSDEDRLQVVLAGTQAMVTLLNQPARQSPIRNSDFFDPEVGKHESVSYRQIRGNEEQTIGKPLMRDMLHTGLLTLIASLPPEQQEKAASTWVQAFLGYPDDIARTTNDVMGILLDTHNNTSNDMRTWALSHGIQPQEWDTVVASLLVSQTKERITNSRRGRLIRLPTLLQEVVYPDQYSLETVQTIMDYLTDVASSAYDEKRTISPSYAEQLRDSIDSVMRKIEPSIRNNDYIQTCIEILNHIVNGSFTRGENAQEHLRGLKETRQAYFNARGAIRRAHKETTHDANPSDA